MESAAVKENSNSSKQTVSLVQGIKFKEKLGYGLGDLASNLVWSSLSMFILFFYTDVVGIAAGVIGTIMLLVRIMDGALDILMGVTVDRTRSKHGKARPWLLWMGIPFGIATILLFTVPDVGLTGKVVYVAITYVLINVIYTAINIPYGVLNSLITQDQYERSTVNIFRMFLSTAGTLCVSLLVLPMVRMFGNGQAAWVSTFVIFGIVGSLLFIVTFLTTKERVKPADISQEKTNIPIKIGLKALFSNKYWLIVVSFLVITFVNLGVSGGVMVYFAQYILGTSDLVGVLSLAQNIPTLVGMLLFAAPIIKKFGKRNATIFGSVVTLIGLGLVLINPENVTLIIIATIIKGLGGVPLGASMFAMLADTIEYGEWKSGVRTEGLIYSAGSFGLKVGIGLGTAVVGWVLAWGNYIGGAATQPDSAIFSINFAFIILPIVLTILQMILLGFYKLDKEYPQIVKDLQERSTY
ncbi:MFS transporter [Peribacillus loiseleuriae]|uniref:MFS transporter n=1 Tax=Peribacillus loiseleuriae TaxID=1679170 RepID=UPI0038232E07